LSRISRIENSKLYTALDHRDDYRIQKNAIVELDADSHRALLRTCSTVANARTSAGSGRPAMAQHRNRRALVTLCPLALLAGRVAKARARRIGCKRGREIAPRSHSA
jgi:hypothetical protein